MDTGNSFSSLLSENDSIGPPDACSSPKATSHYSKTSTIHSWNKFVILNINFQNIKNKKAELLNIIDSYNPNIIIGTETWLTESIHSSEIFPSSYNVYRKDRKGTIGGGVLIAIRTDVISEQLSADSDTESIYATVTLEKGNRLIIGALYRPPSSSAEYMDNLCSSLESVTAKYRKAVMWVGGDLNLPDIDWKTQSIVGNSNPVFINQRFLDCVHHCGLEQKVDFPTRQAATLDLFLTNRPTLVDKCSAAPGIADHDMVQIAASVSAKRNKPVARKIFLWDKADMEAVRTSSREVASEFCTTFSTSSPIESMWTFIKEKLLRIQEEHVPSKTTSTRFSQPWVTREIKQISRRKKRSYWKARRTGSAKDIKRYKHLKDLSRTTCRSAYNSYITNIISPDSTSNPKRFWSFVKSPRTDSSGVAPLKDTTGTTHSESSKKADILNSQFSSVFNKDERGDTIPDKGPSPHCDMPAICVGVEGVYKILTNLQIHKATGPDNIPCRILKETAKEIAPMLQLFFQASLDQGQLPKEWKTANVVPIFKKGEKSKAENYRPVSLTSVTCKMLEHIVCSSIMRHLDMHKILHDAQHGFRKRRSCESQLILTVQDLAKNIDNRGQTDLILLDFSKAFDKVPHKRLLYKINYYGVRNSTLWWIGDFLGGRTQQVLLEGVTSSTAPVQSGVPQGSVLGPLLFLLFINDLPDAVSEGSAVRLFADDCALYRDIKSAADAIQLQEDLNNLQKWEADWLMEFHPKKCQVLNITNKRNVITHPYSIHGHTLDVVDSTKYLGVHIHKSLKWNHHIDQVAKKANNTLAFLRRNFHQCPRNTKALCYTTLVRPLTEYSSVIWDPYTAENIRKLEMVQRRAARMVYSNYQTTSSVSAMLNHLNWMSLQERRAQAKAVMMYRVVNQQIDIPSQILVPTISPRGNNISYLVPYARTLTYQKSFFPDGIRIWNSLPSVAVCAPSVDSFKFQIQAVNIRG